MKDPYAVLGLPRTASDDEVKKAYRKLSRIYHPDANINNPNKEQAEEKFKEIQQAYQAIMNKEAGGAQESYGGGQGYYGGHYGGFEGFGGFGGYSNGYGRRTTQQNAYEDDNTRYLHVAENYIRNRAFQEAVNILRSVTEHTAYWHYLYGVANAGLRNQAAALEHLQEAVRMEPGNATYRQTYEQLQGGGEWYRTTGSLYGAPVGEMNGMCWKLCLANMLCNICLPGSFCI